MEELIASIMRLGSADLASEEAACAAFVRVRFPNGIEHLCRCGAPCVRTLARMECRRRHRFTILVDTPFGTKRNPSVRALFLAIRHFALTHRSISAMELAREVGAAHATTWRHLQTLRALLPAQAAVTTEEAGVAQMCGRRSRAVPAHARVAQAASLVSRAPVVGGDVYRLVAQSARTVLNGTFHGVRENWLSRYLDEITARWRFRDGLIEVLLHRLLADTVALPFRLVAIARAA